MIAPCEVRHDRVDDRDAARCGWPAPRRGRRGRPRRPSRRTARRRRARRRRPRRWRPSASSGQVERVVAAEPEQVGGGHDVGGGPQVALGVLDRHDVGCSARREQGVGAERDAGARRGCRRASPGGRWRRRRPGSARRGRPGWACCSRATTSRSASAPASRGPPAISTAWRVSLEPTPATTLARSPARCLTRRTISMLSSSVRVEDSPVVPLTTMPSWPASSRWSTSASVPLSSISPPRDIGVTIAVRTRPKGDVVMPKG